jgi:hypothetical protein
MNAAETKLGRNALTRFTVESLQTMYGLMMTCLLGKSPACLAILLAHNAMITHSERKTSLLMPANIHSCL